MLRGKHFRRKKPSEAGITLLEILIAVALLGMSFTAIFSGLSAALRATRRLDEYRAVVDFATRKLNELMLETKFAPGQELSGISDSGMRWRARAERVGSRPGPDPDRPFELVRVILEVSWGTPSQPQNFVLERLKFWIPPASPGS